ncbi:MAG: carbohydrate binding domain-containing protein [Dictyoglomus sp.]|nr:carbohydrate binding domain-containing protein [Dictyoglomus sp.]MDW8188212.1 carbohydrate binding domain-containing protein [Dictyoglomus sp.]
MKKYSIFILIVIYLYSLFITGCARPIEVPSTSPAPSEPIPKTEVQIPKAEEIKGLILLTTFETGEEGWQPFGGGVKISISEKVARSGKFSLYVEGRSAGWHGAQIPLKNILQPGKTYNISTWIYQESGTDQRMILTMRRKYSTDESTQYNWIRAQFVPNKKWTEFRGSYSIPSGAIIEDLALYIEAPDNANLTFYIDDLVITEKGSSFKLNPELLTLISKYIK